MDTRKLLAMMMVVMVLGGFEAAITKAAAPVNDSIVTLPAGIGHDWWTTVQRNIRAAEYQITWQDRTALADLPAAYQAPNRAQNFRTYFTADGIRVIPRTAAHEAPSWEWGLHVIGYGFADAPDPGFGKPVRSFIQPVAAATPTTNGNRVEYRRGDLTEWYVNDARGLEQGFTLHAPPKNGQGWIALELVLRGNVTPKLTDGGTAIDFLTADGAQAIRYDTLRVTDADGRALAAQFALLNAEAGERPGIRIIVEAAEARYPITIDPLATSPNWTVEGNQAEAYFGWSVGTAGDVNGDGYSDVIIGALGYDNGQTDEGRAYVYHGSASGLSATPAWTVESDQAEVYFGYAVGTAGDVNGDGYSEVIVGACDYNNGQSREGRAFVYHGSAGGLSVSVAWTAESDQADALFGSSVGTAGDVNGDGYSDVIIGADLYDNGQTDEGRVFVYYGSNGGLGEAGTPLNADWTAESDQDGAWFGWSAGTAGDVNGDGYSDVIIGAEKYDNGQTNEGRAFVYHGTPSVNSYLLWTK